MTKKLARSFIKAIPWTIGDALISIIYGVSMVVLLGRLVSAADVGIGSIALATCQIVEALTAGGLQEAVIRTRSGDTTVTDTAYVLAILSSILGFFVCVALGWPLTLIFSDHRLFALLVVSGLILPTNALTIIPTAILARKMRAPALTRRFVFGKICGIITLLVTGFGHFGPWCLILSGLAVSVGSLISVFVGSQRWPRLRFKLNEAATLMRFGRLIAMDTFAWICATRVFAILFGFFHGVIDLGYFQFGQRLVDEIAALLQTSFARLGFSYFSGLNREGREMRSTFEMGTRLLTAVSAAVYVGLALVADDLVLLMFGVSWTPMVPLIQILALAWAISFPFILTPPALKAKGRPDLLFWFGLVKGLFTLAAGVVTGGLSANFGVACWAAGMVLTVPWSLIQINEHLGIPILLQFYQMIPSAIATATMCVIITLVYVVGYDASPVCRLGASITLGAIAYCLAIWKVDPVLRGIVASVFVRMKWPRILAAR